MRVIGGKYRSRKLDAFAGESVRPTADRTRESLFNILQGKIVGTRFLDAFSGTGAVGIEALSRGAAECVFLDSDKKSALIAEGNFKRLGINAKVLLTRAEDYLQKCGRFDIVFLDPPYRSECGKNALEIIGKRDILTENGVAIFEHAEPFTGEIEGLCKIDERKYGKAYLTFFGREKA